MVGAVLSLFLLVTKRLYGKDREWSIGQIKTCRKKQHVKIDDIKEMSDLICGKAAVVGNYNSTRDSLWKEPEHDYMNHIISWLLGSAMCRGIVNATELLAQKLAKVISLSFSSTNESCMREE